jgi:hypothetical protein
MRFVRINEENDPYQVGIPLKQRFSNITMQATSGGGDYSDYFLYNPKKKRFELWRSES